VKTIAYDPARDELVAGSCRNNGGEMREFGPFKLCWDRRMVVRGLAIRQARQQLREFRRALRIVPLGGILRDVRVSDDDIRESRHDLLKRIEKGW
jgi:hypothetical protein